MSFRAAQALLLCLLPLLSPPSAAQSKPPGASLEEREQVVELGTPSFTTATIFNAASYDAGRFAPESWVAIFGAHFAEAVVVPSDGLPLSVAGTTVTVTDADGVSRPASLRFVAPTVLSFLSPAGLASGPGSVTIANSRGLSGSAEAQIELLTPGLFTANEVGGHGPVLATFLRVLEDGNRVEGFTFISTATSGRGRTVPCPSATAKRNST